MTKKGKLFTKNGEEWIEIGGNSEISQDANGITIGETALQDASTSQDGLMTKEQVASLNGKASESAVQTAKSKADSAYNLANGKLDKTGGITTYSSDYKAKQVRNTYISTRTPSSSDGVNGDRWIKI